MATKSCVGRASHGPRTGSRGVDLAVFVTAEIAPFDVQRERSIPVLARVKTAFEAKKALGPVASSRHQYTNQQWKALGPLGRSLRDILIRSTHSDRAHGERPTEPRPFSPPGEPARRPRTSPADSVAHSVRSVIHRKTHSARLPSIRSPLAREYLARRRRAHSRATARATLYYSHSIRATKPRLQ